MCALTFKVGRIRCALYIYIYGMTWHYGNLPLNYIINSAKVFLVYYRSCRSEMAKAANKRARAPTQRYERLRLTSLIFCTCATMIERESELVSESVRCLCVTRAQEPTQCAHRRFPCANFMHIKFIITHSNQLSRRHQRLHLSDTNIPSTM